MRCYTKVSSKIHLGSKLRSKKSKAGKNPNNTHTEINKYNIINGKAWKQMDWSEWRRKKHTHETLFSHAFRYNTYMYELLLHPNNFNNNSSSKTHEPIFYFHKNIDVRLKCCIIVCNLFYWSTFACVAFDSFVLSWGHRHHKQWTCFVWNKIWCGHMCVFGGHCLAGIHSSYVHTWWVWFPPSANEIV